MIQFRMSYDLCHENKTVWKPIRVAMIMTIIEFNYDDGHRIRYSKRLNSITKKTFTQTLHL
jgi:hypothetical protein